MLMQGFSGFSSISRVAGSPANLSLASMATLNTVVVDSKWDEVKMNDLHSTFVELPIL